MEPSTNEQTSPEEPILSRTLLNDGVQDNTKNKDKKVEKVPQTQKNCTHFLMERCRHGFTGKKAFGEILQCPFIHPKICRPFMKNGFGEGGCQNGQNCEFVHPKMCSSSLKYRKCGTKGPKCDGGYHLKRTSCDQENSPLESKSKTDDKSIGNGKNKSKKSKSTPSQINEDFLGELVKEQILKIFSAPKKAKEKPEKQNQNMMFQFFKMMMSQNQN